MKRILGLMTIAFLLASCNSGVPDGVKSIAMSRALLGGKIKLPASAKSDDIEVYKAFSDILSVSVEKSEEQEDGSFKVFGKIETKDSDKVEGVMLAIMFSSRAKGESIAQEVSRSIASIEQKIKNSKGHKPKPMSQGFVLTYKVKDGKEVVTSFKKQ